MLIASRLLGFVLGKKRNLLILFELTSERVNSMPGYDDVDSFDRAKIEHSSASTLPRESNRD